jgi:hypothetical protein
MVMMGRHLTHSVADTGKIDLRKGEASGAACYSKRINCLTDMATLS